MTTHGASNGLRFTFGNRFGAPQKKKASHGPIPNIIAAI